MRLPQISYDVGKSQSEIVAMRGINYSDQIQDGDLRDILNLSARRYPYITTRHKRAQRKEYAAATALTAWGKLVAVEGTNLLYDGEIVGQVSEGEKQFAVVNTKMVIWPDRVYLDLVTKEIKSLGAVTDTLRGSATFTKNSLTCTINLPKGSKTSDRLGRNYSESYSVYAYSYKSVEWTGSAWNTSGGKASSVTAGNLVGRYVILDTSGHLPIYFSTESRPNENKAGLYGIITSVGYERIESSNAEYFWFTADVYDGSKTNEDFTTLFSVGDAITIEGCATLKQNNTTAVVSDVSGTKLTFSSDIFTAGTESAVIKVSRKIPALDYICESENRLWGCSNADQTIYASALGDPTNFYLYEGVATDSFAVTVGTEGNFTGCCKYSSSILFWKETKLHKILGSFPAEYTLYTNEIEGLQKGCHKSLQVINEVLFYMGPHGVYAYSGGTPSLISANFGDHEFGDAVAGNDGDNYYLSVTEGEETHLMVYETRNGIWVREDDTRAVDFARIGKDLYFLDSSGNVWLADSRQDDPDVEWLAQFTPFYETIQGRKTYSRLLLRLELPKGSYLIAEVCTDGKVWRECGKVVGRERDAVPLRIALNRCDKFEVRLRGKGPCTILSMLREFSVGSDV